MVGQLCALRYSSHPLRRWCRSDREGWVRPHYKAWVIAKRLVRASHYHLFVKSRGRPLSFADMQLRWLYANLDHSQRRRAKRALRRAARRHPYARYLYASIASPVGMGNDGQKAYDLASRTWFGTVIGTILAGGVPWADVTNVKYAGGAKLNGINSDYAAIHAAINAASATASGFGTTRSSVLIPPGVAIIDSSAVLTEDIATSVRAGILVWGMGPDASKLRLSPSGSDLYFYDNVATPRMQFMRYMDLGFEGMDPSTFTTYTSISANAKGFRLWATTATGSHEQGHKWLNCHLGFLNSFYETAGNNTTSENSFIQCRFLEGGAGQFALINNLQSYDHEFLNCDWVDMFGHVFNMGANGGGAVKCIGGSCVMQSQIATTSYFWNQPNAPQSGASGDLSYCDGLKLELLGNFTNLVSIAGIGYQNVVFLNADIHDTGGVSKPAFVTILQQSKVLFRNVSFIEAFVGALQFTCAGGNTAYGGDGEIGFEHCDVPIDWSERMATPNVGYIWAKDCTGTNIGALGAGVHYAHDFNYRQGTVAGLVASWPGDGTVKDFGSLSHMNAPVFTAHMKLSSEQFPLGVATESTLKLPKGQIIKNLRLLKPPRAGDGNLAQLQITNNGKTVVHLLTPPSPATWGPNAYSGAVANYDYCVGDTVGERTLRLSVVGAPAQPILGGIVAVDYY